MKKYNPALVAAVLLASMCAMPTAQSAPLPTLLNYAVSMHEGSEAWMNVELGTYVGAHTPFSSITEEPVVSAINSKNGEVSVETAVRKSGIVLDLAAKAAGSDGKYPTTVEYTIWDHGLTVVKGTHQFTLAAGEKVTLPGLPDYHITVALAPAVSSN